MNFTKHQRALPAIPTEIAIHVSVLDSPRIKNALKLEEDLAHIRLWIFFFVVLAVVAVVWNACTLLSIIKDKRVSGGGARGGAFHIQFNITTHKPNHKHLLFKYSTLFPRDKSITLFSLCFVHQTKKKRREEKVKNSSKKRDLAAGGKVAYIWILNHFLRAVHFHQFIRSFVCMWIISFGFFCFHHKKLTSIHLKMLFCAQTEREREREREEKIVCILGHINSIHCSLSFIFSKL